MVAVQVQHSDGNWRTIPGDYLDEAAAEKHARKVACFWRVLVDGAVWCQGPER